MCVSAPRTAPLSQKQHTSSCFTSSSDSPCAFQKPAATLGETVISNLGLRLTGKRHPVRFVIRIPFNTERQAPGGFLTQKVMSQLNWLDRSHRGTKGLIRSNLSPSPDWHHSEASQRRRRKRREARTAQVDTQGKTLAQKWKVPSVTAQEIGTRPHLWYQPWLSSSRAERTHRYGEKHWLQKDGHDLNGKKKQQQHANKSSQSGQDPTL